MSMTRCPVRVDITPVGANGVALVAAGAMAESDGVQPKPRPPARKPRKPSLATRIKQLEKATGRRVTSAITPEGYTLSVGELSPEASQTRNEWDEALKKHGPH